MISRVVSLDVFHMFEDDSVECTTVNALNSHVPDLCECVYVCVFRCPNFASRVRAFISVDWIAAICTIALYQIASNSLHLRHLDRWTHSSLIALLIRNRAFGS